MGEQDPYDLEGQQLSRIERDKRDRQAQFIEAEDLKWLMSSKRGRRYMWGLLDRAGVFRLSFNTTAMVMAFNEGLKNEGLRQLALVNQHCPDRYLEMLAEHRKHVERNSDDGRGNGN